MESVAFCICKNCDLLLGKTINLWTKLAHYASPVVVPDDGLLIKAYGKVHEGRKGFILEHCQVQNVACSVCLHELGFKCIATPVNHVLEEGQVFLRLKRVLLRDDENEVDFVFKRVLIRAQSLNGPSTSSGGPSPSANEAVDVFKLQSELQLQQEDISRIDTNGAKVVPSLGSGLTNIERQVKNLQDTLGNVRRDVSGVEEEVKSVKTEVGEVKRLAQSHPPAAAWEERLGSVTSTIGEVQEKLTGLASQLAELTWNKQHVESLESNNKQSAPPGQHDQVMTGILAELAQLRREMDGMRSKGQVQNSTPFPSRDLEILTANMTKIGGRASQVEPLQMEFELLKGRLERMEANGHISDSASGPRPFATGIRQDSPAQLKRSLSKMGGPITQDVASKKQMVSPPGYSNAPTESHDTSPRTRRYHPSTSETYTRLSRSASPDLGNWRDL
ncbi:hypothetical protein QBC37DRAFT_14029 [Rhypophila decipiens]|uniref:Uncharacterized protein n=1 Tax=Rhypophila decipiens TaxID=261697 RepID=A0AAN7B632_9PEZI|nr:hypothetical protein QBC37DRAFT_14029 [Rhypophila decipiens]